MVDRGDKKSIAGDRKKSPRAINPVWRQVATQASSSEDCLLKDVTVEVEDVIQIQEIQCSTSSSTIDTGTAGETTEVTDLTISSFARQENAPEEKPVLSTEKHSASVEVGASLIRFIKGKGGSTQERIEEEMGVKIIIPPSKIDDSVIIEGISVDAVTRASEKIQAIIDEAVNSPSLDYSHFISLPLALHPELVEKLVNFQNSILGTASPSLDEVLDGSDTNGENTDNEVDDRVMGKRPNVAVQLKVDDDKERVKVNITKIPIISYPPKASKSSTISDLGIDKSIFIKPKTFHLTVLMLKLWNQDRINTAAEVLRGLSSKVMEALDNRPILVRLKGLDCMKGSLARACVLYAPVEEIGGKDRLSRACLLDKDAKQKLKLHATVMNARHRKRKTRTRKVDSFDARDIFKQYGSEDWGEYLISEAHLSQRFVFDENGYYHCCASIPFPGNMQVD